MSHFFIRSPEFSLPRSLHRRIFRRLLRPKRSRSPDACLNVSSKRRGFGRPSRSTGQLPYMACVIRRTEKITDTSVTINSFFYTAFLQRLAVSAHAVCKYRCPHLRFRSATLVTSVCFCNRSSVGRWNESRGKSLAFERHESNFDNSAAPFGKKTIEPTWPFFSSQSVVDATQTLGNGRIKHEIHKRFNAESHTTLQTD